MPIRHDVVLAHPGSRSLCRLLAEAYCETCVACGQAVELRDLYAIGFDPRLSEQERPHPSCQLHADAAAELDLVGGADVLVLACALWFGRPSAIIKGYIDRVLGAKFAAANMMKTVPSQSLAGKRLVTPVLIRNNTTLARGKGAVCRAAPGVRAKSD